MEHDEIVKAFKGRLKHRYPQCSAPEEYLSEQVNALYSVIHKLHGPKLVQMLKDAEHDL